MSAEANKAILRQVYEAAFNQKNLDALNEVIASDSTDHNLTPEQPPGLQGAKQVFSSFHTAFPDLQVDVEDMITEGDKVVARLTVRGTHQGEFMGIAPTGNQVTFTGIDIVRIAEGKIVERWGNFDDLGMMHQLGVIEQPSGRSGNPSKGPESGFGRSLALLLTLIHRSAWKWNSRKLNFVLTAF